ncbi:restriction endonuclease [Nocardioides sp. CN2-186]|uniref:restriction endonuclease n=1 Tax=Nocardioides tweenelious TaxID=3156607 RepID=UPI0032B4D8D4
MSEALTPDAPPGALVGRFSLRWVAPPGWDDAPPEFEPEVDWRPSRYWPTAPDNWEFWQVVADDEVAEMFYRGWTRPPARPEPVWVAPPHWPPAPPGWHPPRGWTPDRQWRAAPPGWQFWRQPQADETAIARAKLATRSDRLGALNAVEALMRVNAEHRATMASAQAQVHISRLPSMSARRRARKGLAEAQAAADEGMVRARAALKSDLYADRGPSPEAVALFEVAELRLHNSFAWGRHVLGLTPAETDEERRLRWLNSLTFGAGNLDEAESAAHNSPLDLVVVEAMWQQAEQLSAAALRQFGYPDATVTPGGADSGLDVTSTRVVAQVKYTSRPVTRPTMQQLAGASGGRRMAFFSLSGYTSQAAEFADERGIALFDIELPGRITPSNAWARSMAAGELA